MQLTLKALQTSKRPVYALGPLIHNPAQIKKLEERGLKTISSLGQVKDGIIIVPSHGLSPGALKMAKQKGFSLIDATCPYVRHSQTLAAHLKEKGYTVVVIGQKAHPEVKAIMACLGKKGKVVGELKEISNLPFSQKTGVIAQTTESMERFSSLTSALLQKTKELRAFNTLCIHTIRRQEEAKKLARRSDLMLVLGGHNSANTRRLFKICQQVTSVRYLETEKALKKKDLRNKKRIGVVSGTSTPQWIVNAVLKRLRALHNESIKEG